MLCLRAIEIVHRSVQPGEDGWGDVEWQLLMEELLLLRLTHEHSVIHGHVLATSFCVHCQVLEVRHSWKDKRTEGRSPSGSGAAVLTLKPSKVTTELCSAL